MIFNLDEKSINIFYITCFLLVFFHCSRNNMELFGNYKSECDYLPTAVVLALKKRKMKKVGDNSWDYYLPCGYTYCEDNVRGFKNEKSGKKIFMIDGCDWIASKVTLWQLIKKKFGNEASSIMPETFVLSNIKDMYKFKKFYQLRKSIHSGSKFIVKNFQQRQEGLKLLNNIDEINTSIKDGFKLVQDYLENPYLISKRKVNLRYYILVICHQGVINAYVYKDGFVYYTPKFFEKYSMDFHKNITTGYIDRRVYEENPLTVDEFRKRLGPEKAKKWDNEVIKKLNMVMVALSEQICSCDKLSKHVRFQIFGADLAPDENLEGTLMEINKGPDIGFKDDKDGKVKKEMVDGAFSIIEGEKDKDHGYSRIF